MSIELQTRVWKESLDLSGVKLLLLLALADYADDENRCFPKVATLARKIRVDERGTRRHLKELKDAGYVRVLDQSAGRKSNIYQIFPNPGEITMVKQPGLNNHGKNTTPNPGEIATPPNLYNESPIEPPIIAPKVATPSPKKKRKHPIPSDWQPSNPSIATQYNLDPVAASQYFIDWAISSGKTYTDWDRVWANACKSWLQEKPALRPGNAIQQSSTLEKVDYAEPAGWRGFVSRTYPAATVARIEESFDNDWDNLPASMKETITQDMSNE